MNDPIGQVNQTLGDAIRATAQPSAHCGTIPATVEQLAAIAQPSETGGWIPCSEREPQVAGWYLVHIDCRTSTILDHDEVLYCDGGRWGRRSHNAHLPISHWQPRPAPPMGGGA